MRDALFVYFDNAASSKHKNWTEHSLCVGEEACQIIETVCRLCRCFCKEKPVESVFLSPTESKVFYLLWQIAF